MLALNTLSSEFNEVPIEKQKRVVYYKVLKIASDPQDDDYCDKSGSGGWRSKNAIIVCVFCAPRTNIWWLEECTQERKSSSHQ